GDAAAPRPTLASTLVEAASARLCEGEYGPFRARQCQVVQTLQVHPELRRRVECLTEEPGSVRGDAALSTNDLVYALNGNADVLCEGHLGQSERRQELLKEDFAWVRRDAILGKHDASL